MSVKTKFLRHPLLPIKNISLVIIFARPNTFLQWTRYIVQERGSDRMYPHIIDVKKILNRAHIKFHSHTITLCHKKMVHAYRLRVSNRNSVAHYVAGRNAIFIAISARFVAHIPLPHCAQFATKSVLSCASTMRNFRRNKGLIFPFSYTFDCLTI